MSGAGCQPVITGRRPVPPTGCQSNAPSPNPFLVILNAAQELDASVAWLPQDDSAYETPFCHGITIF
jgi:hypothetical protein